MTEAQSREPRLQGRRVLIVEDQYLIAEDVIALVERLGGRVAGPAKDVASALALLRSDPVDLALLDVNLDGERVYQVAEALRAASVPFAFTTGYDPWAIDPRFGDAPHLEKPITAAALGALLDRMGPGGAGR